MTGDLRHIIETRSRDRQEFAKLPHRTCQIHADVAESAFGTKDTGDREPGSERATSEIDDDGLSIRKSRCEEHPERRGKLLKVPELIEVRVENDTVLRRQIAPRFVERGLTPTDGLHRRRSIDTEEWVVLSGTGITPHALQKRDRDPLVYRLMAPAANP